MRLILLPGLDGTGRLFSSLLGALPPQFEATVLTYPPDEQRSYPELCERVTAMLPYGEPYTIVAESFSGPIAIRIAAAGPPNLQAVVLCASFVHFPASYITRLFLSILSRFLFLIPAPRFAIRYLLAGDDAPEELLTAFYEATSTVSHTVLSHRLRIALAADERASLRAMSVPLLLLHPTGDRLLGDGGVNLMSQLRPEIAISHIEAPHFILQRNPTEAVRTIERWMEEQGLTDRSEGMA